MLGEFLEENCPDVSVQVVIKSNEDWTDYIDSVSRSLLLAAHAAPIALTIVFQPEQELMF